MMQSYRMAAARTPEPCIELSNTMAAMSSPQCPFVAHCGELICWHARMKASRDSLRIFR